MGRHGSADTAFALFGGRDIVSTLQNIEFESEAVLEETTVLGVGDEEHAAVGLSRGALRHSGFYDDGTDSVNDHLVDHPESVACIGLEGNTIGKKFTGWAGAIVGRYRRQASRDELHKAEGEYTVDGAVEEGVILHAHGEETAASGDTESTPVDNGVSSADGGAGYLQVSALTLGGYTSVTVKIRDSADDITYADLIAFTAVTSAPAGERKTVAGTVDRYLAMSWAFNGSGSGQSVTLMTGFGRN